MAELLLPYVEAHPGEPALTDERGSTTWREFNDRVNRLANALRALGLHTGDAIALHTGNRRENLELMTAAGHIGLVYVLVNWHWTADELRFVLEDSGARVVFSEDVFGEVALAATDDTFTRFAIGGRIAGFKDYEEFVASGGPAEPEGQLMGWPGIYTSGTTGRPKCVKRKDVFAGSPLVVAQLLGDYLAEVCRIPAGGRSLLVGPAYHSAQWLWSYGFLVRGRSVVMRAKFDAAETLRLIDEHAITNVHLVPTQFVRLLRLPSADRESFSGASLEAVWHGAAPCSPDVKQQMIAWFGEVIHEYYGSTESSVNTVAYADEWLRKPGTVGRALPICEVHVLREDGTPADTGENGRLFFRYTSGDDVYYHGDPAKTASMHRPDGLFTTGDIGHLDPDGYLFLADRAIDMIISGGVNIYPAEIEGVLVAHPSVADAAVFGIPNEEFGEEVTAVIELLDPSEASPTLADTLLTHARERLASYKIPRTLTFAPLPRTPTGKLIKRHLRDPHWQNHNTSI